MSKTARTDDGRMMFWCPGCGEYHWISDLWSITGNPDQPTFEPSVLVSGVQWPEKSSFYRPTHHVVPGEQRTCHSFVREGRIEYLADCTHHLAGQTVEMVDLEVIRATAEAQAS